MWQRTLDRVLARTIRQGSLTLHHADGTLTRHGDGSGPDVSVTCTDPAFPRRFLLNPERAVGEAYTEGALTIAGDDLHGFLELGVRNMPQGVGIGVESHVGPFLRRLRQYNPAPRARRNVAHHYDLSRNLYDLFLDADRQYSCAYFKTPDDSLETAQAQKKAHIARKLCLEPGMRVLDIGCGWGGMALTLARDFGVRVVGVTLSEEQCALARERVAEAGLDGRVEIRLQDYRAVSERFDRIVSVGMFEHVGVPHYDEYFAKLCDLLAEDGVALVHSIGRRSPPGRTSPWIERYIFPGGYVPSLSEMAAAFERQGLWLTDLEVLRLHYAMTLRHWYDRFMANLDAARALYDERFCRMWRFYLVASEQTFRFGQQGVFQAQLARRRDAVPLTRDYLCGTG